MPERAFSARIALRCLAREPLQVTHRFVAIPARRFALREPQHRIARTRRSVVLQHDPQVVPLCALPRLGECRAPEQRFRLVWGARFGRIEHRVDECAPLRALPVVHQSLRATIARVQRVGARRLGDRLADRLGDRRARTGSEQRDREQRDRDERSECRAPL